MEPARRRPPRARRMHVTRGPAAARMALAPATPRGQGGRMEHLDALIGLVVLVAVSLTIAGQARDEEPFIARILRPLRRDPGTGRQADDIVRWRWGGGHPM